MSALSGYRRIINEKLEEIEDVIANSELCLEEVKRSQEPYEWALIHKILGNAYMKRKVSLNENIEISMGHFKESLQIFSKEASLEDWAESHLGLGETLTLHIGGVHSQNIENSIHHIKLCTTALNEDHELFSRAQKLLGIAWIEKRNGDVNLNIRNAIEYLYKALETTDKENYLMEWSKIHTHLADAMRRNWNGSRAENLKLAISYSKTASEVIQIDQYPLEWAQASTVLGRTLLDIESGDLEKNAEEAMNIFLRVLEIYNEEQMPKEWASIQKYLGDAFIWRISGNRKQNLTQSISHYENSWRKCREEQMKFQVAETQMCWSIARIRRDDHRSRGDLGRTVKCLLLCLTVFTKEEMPLQWAYTCYNLANALLINGHLSEAFVSDNFGSNFRSDLKGRRMLSADYFTSSLEVFSLTVRPDLWACCHNDLARTYLIGKEYESALEHFQKSLQVFTKEGMPFNWGNCHFNIAVALYERGLHDKNSILQAIDHCEKCFEIFSLQSFPLNYAQTNYKLGNILYGSRILFPANVDRAVKCYKNSLMVYTKEDNPQQWAEVNFNCGVVLLETSSRNRHEEVEESIKHTKLSLTIYNELSEPVKWALANRNLGNAKLVSQSGKKKEDIESAIFYYKKSLRFIKERSMPEFWAGIQMNLGIAMKDRIEGKVGSNIESAISHYKNSLKVYNKLEHPQPWAIVHTNYGNAMQDRRFENKSENLTESIKHYVKALEILSEDQTPLLWAKVYMNMGNTIVNRAEYTNGGNIENAIQCYNNALRVMTEKEMPTQWAVVQLNLGNYHFALLREGARSNLQISRKHYLNSLGIHTKDVAPETWAKLQLNLGNLESRLHNFVEASEHYNNALTVYTKEAFPLDWALVHLNMANMFHEDNHGENSESIERTIHHFRKSLEIFTEQDLHLEKSKTYLSMASFFQELNHINLFISDRTNYDTRSIEYYTQTLRYSSENWMPILWAKVQNNLGNAYLDKALGDRSDNVEMAIECFNKAIDIIEDGHAFLLAQVRVNLANAYMSRIGGSPSQNLEEAVNLYKNCCGTITREEMEISWAGIQMNLGNAMTKQEKPDLAAEYYKNALEVYGQRSNPSRWATVHYNLGHNSLRFKEKRLENIDDSILHFEKSLEIRTKEKYPVLWAESQLGLSIAHFRKSKIRNNESMCRETLEICQSFEDILDTSEDLVLRIQYMFHVALLLSWLKFDKQLELSLDKCLDLLAALQNLAHVGLLHSRVLSDDYSYVYEMKANMYLRAGNYSQALQAFESGKSYLLSFLMNEGSFLLEKADETMKKEIQQTLHYIRCLKNRVDKGDREAYKKYGQAMKKLKKYADNLHVSQSEFHPQLVLKKELSQEELIRFISSKQCACIYFHIHYNEESLYLTIFEIGYGKVEMVHSAVVPEFVAEAAYKLFINENCSSHDEENYLKEFGRLLDSCQLFSKSSIREDLRSVVIIPHRFLHNIPFSAIHVRRNESTIRLGEMFTNGIYICPSLKVLLDLSYRTVGHKISHDSSASLFTGDEGTTAGVLAFSTAVKKMFPQSECFQDGFEEKTYFRESRLLLTYSHGYFPEYNSFSFGVRDRSNLIESTKLGLKGADTLLKIWNLKLTSHLAIIVACEGARVDVRSRNDESLSIGTGFLIGGAQNVICALWPVHATSAVIVICRYLKTLLLEGESVDNQELLARYLEDAKSWYRDLDSEKHMNEIRKFGLSLEDIPNNKNVRNWAPFILIGSPI